MSNRNKRYSQEFKTNIINMYREEGSSMSFLAREYDVTVSTVSKWINNSEPIELENGQTMTRQEFLQLQKENKILKAAAVLLGKH